MDTGVRSATAVMVGALLLAGCGGTSTDADSASEDVTSAPTAAASVSATFLNLTAEHLCSVQAQVYPDAAALADAFDAAPEYPGIDASDVRRLTRRLDKDPGFARDLNERISATCG